MNRPAIVFSEAVQAELKRYTEAQRKALQSWFEAGLKPGYLLTSTRVSAQAQRPSALGRLLGRKPAAAVLPVDASKFGGRPYLESLDEWPRHGSRPYQYLAQVNFADIDGHVPEAPRRGLLVFYQRTDWPCRDPGVCRWYPDPAASKAVPPPGPVPSIPRYEAQIGFAPFWTLPDSDVWQQMLEGQDERLWGEVLEWKDAFATDRGYGDSHALFPQATGALLEKLQVQELRDATTVLRLAGDQAAGFGWGTNWVYYLVNNEDLRAGRLDGITCSIANA